MNSFLRTAIGVLVGVLLGAALVIGYIQFQPAAAAMAPATNTVANSSTASTVSNAAGDGAAVNVYEQVGSAVVYIKNTSNQRGMTGQQTSGTGSGFFIDKEGHIVTNNHVIDNAAKLEVTLMDGTSVPATVVGTDPSNDIAVIKVDLPADKITVAPLGDSSTLKVGQLAIAIGNPFGYEGTVTSGIISGLGRAQAQSGGRLISNMIQTDAAINPGNSGGPLLNAQGQVVGITSSIESTTGGSVGVGFAIPINLVKAELSNLQAGKAVEHAWLGIVGSKVTADLNTKLGLGTDRGAYVLAVSAGGPADKAGLHGATTEAMLNSNSTTDSPQGGDVIIAVDGKSVSSVEEIASYIDAKNPGDVIVVKVLRSQQEKDLKVTLGKWSDNTTNIAD